MPDSPPAKAEDRASQLQESRDQNLRVRVATLEDQFEQLIQERRDTIDALAEYFQVDRRTVLRLSAGGLSLGALTALASSPAAAEASTSDGDGDVGTPADPVDVFADGIDANSITWGLEVGLDISGSRSFNTTYENTNSYAILVNVRTRINGTSQTLRPRLNVASNSSAVEDFDNTIDEIRISSDDLTEYRLKGIVPAGYFYRVEQSGDEIVQDWRERGLNI